MGALLGVVGRIVIVRKAPSSWKVPVVLGTLLGVVLPWPIVKLLLAADIVQLGPGGQSGVALVLLDLLLTPIVACVAAFLVTRPKGHPRCQFSLGTFLVWVLIVGATLGWYGRRFLEARKVRQPPEIVLRLSQLGGSGSPRSSHPFHNLFLRLDRATSPEETQELREILTEGSIGRPMSSRPRNILSP